MAMTSIAPIKQALVHYLRTNAALKAELVGGFHEGFAPSGTKYPYVSYQVHFAPIMYTWDTATHEVGFDVFAWSENSVSEADTLDQLLFTTLQDAELVVEGQSTLICRRVSSLSLPSSDDEGKKIYQAGGIYEVWTDQPIPVIERSSFTADAVLA